MSRFTHITKSVLLLAGMFIMTAALAAEKPAAWYPRTEKVGPDEMFIVALGTGMPTPITRAQKSAAWYVELAKSEGVVNRCGYGRAAPRY